MHRTALNVICLGLLVAACGETRNERMVTGGLGTGLVGALIGGPVGALVGGGLGVVGGAALDESAEVKIARLAEPYVQTDSQTASTDRGDRTAMSGSAARSGRWTAGQVHDKLHAVGYENVYRVRPQGDNFTAQGRREGRMYDITVDGATGRIISSTETDRSGPREAGSGAPGTGVMSEQQIRNALRQDGYDQITSLQRSGNTYRAEAMRDGASYNVTVDGRSGRVVSAVPAGSQGAPSAAPGATDEAQIRDALEKEGYRQISDLRREGSTYVARAQRDGQTFSVRVDAQNGRIVQSTPVGANPSTGQGG